MSMSEKEMKAALFTRCYNLEQEVVQAKELQKELKAEFSYDKEMNTNGLDKKLVAKIMKAAVAKAKQDDLKAKSEELLEIDQIIEEMEA